MSEKTINLTAALLLIVLATFVAFTAAPRFNEPTNNVSQGYLRSAQAYNMACLRNAANGCPMIR